MHLRNAIIFHSILVLAQPTYFTLQWLLNPQYYATISRIRLTIALISWLYILTRITIPTLRFPLRHIPSPPRDTFLLGHGRLMRNQQPPERLTDACHDTLNDGIVAFWEPLYMRVRLVVTTPEAIMEVINTRNYDWEKPVPAKRLLGRVLGNGLINMEGNGHKAMRKSVAPAFSGRHIRDLVPLFYSKGVSFLEPLAREAQSSATSEVEMMGQMSRVTLDIIGSAGIGMDFNTINSDENRLAKLYAIITSTNRGPILPFFLINAFVSPVIVRRLYGTVYSRVAIATQELRGHIRDLLGEKKQHIKQNSAGHNDIIATIMRSGDFPDEYLCDQLLTFFAAGHDTTASALTWTAWLLAKHPSIQEKLRDECQKHLSNLSTEQVTADIIDEMPYLTAVCNETLRIYPTVPLTARIAAVDTRIGNSHIPKGTAILIPIWATNRDKRLWGADAEEFNPDRWLNGSHLDTSGGAKSAYAFLTFLYGPRSCIGQLFSRTEMKCLLAALMMRFRFHEAEGHEVKIGGFVTMKPQGGLKVRLEDLRAGVGSDAKS